MEQLAPYVEAVKAAAVSQPAFYVYAVLAVVGAVSLLSLVVPWLLTFVTYRKQNLAKRYNATWALVTGGSSGIGRSLCIQLAEQGLNIVLAAVGDSMLEKTGEELKARFPHIQFRIVAANLGATDPAAYMGPIEAATKDIPVQVVFNNAGYIVTSFFDKAPLGRWMANYNCNSTAPTVIAHHFVTRLRAEQLRGCIVFTSSPANIIPSPFSTMYGATKAFITHFATSLAVEVAHFGIDIAVCHPSPVATAFYTGAAALPTLHMFKSTATGPDRVADVMIRGVGRSVIIDQGYYPILFRLLLRVVEVTTLAEIMPLMATGIADFKALTASQADTPVAVSTWAKQPETAAAAATAAPAVVAVKAPATGKKGGKKQQQQQEESLESEASGSESEEEAAAAPAPAKAGGSRKRASSPATATKRR